ncbi:MULTISPECIES: ATP-binding protein [unclassified Streptomyces]|uniref:ATP-binding protein n=1 Tax=unclassified Streptomyces TaxID=2593676 RepID=UPI002E28E0BA|nr:ATP-binding protein [Streptomyces sp. NBC_01429]
MLHEDRLNYTPVAGSVTLARHRAARLIAEWGHPELAWSVALVVSELGTNALKYGVIRGRLFQVRSVLRPSGLRVEVSDPRGERLPLARIAADDECFGRGLGIVAQVADRWGTEPRTVGKTVFAEFDVRGGAGTGSVNRGGGGVG